jgi:CRISPR-associated protein (TIGR03986 family)
MARWYPTGEKFVNPYNFVRLDENLPVREQISKGDLSGVINCSLKTLTPLAIPDSGSKREHDQVAGHYVFDFFKTNEAYTIPGSEIRGMIRSVFEAATNSCLSVINTNILSARHPFPRKPGLLKKTNTGWELLQANRYMLNTKRRGLEDAAGQRAGRYYQIKGKRSGQWYIDIGTKKCSTGQLAYFRPTSYKLKTRTLVDMVPGILDIQTSNPGQYKEGYLILWEDIHGKHHNSVFEEIPQSSVSCGNIDEAVQDLKLLMAMYKDGEYQDKNTKARMDYVGVAYSVKEGVGEITPVWYETVADSSGATNVYLSPACISRTVFRNRLEDLLGEHRPCSTLGKNGICPACRLFGMVGVSSGAHSYGSLVRFSDAVIDGESNNASSGKKVLKPLSSPKISSAEFYTELQNDDAKIWNYDYATTSYDDATGTPERILEKAKPNGRKFYHHNLAVNENESIYLNDNETNQNASMELIRENVKFSFDVYFDQISEDQLNQLLWVLTLGDNKADSRKCHKLGHGKPLGLGSAKITANSLKLREINISGAGKLEYSQKDICESEIIKKHIEDAGIDRNSKSLKDLMVITDTQPASVNGAQIAYPIGDDGGNSNNSQASHQWFIGNRQGGEGATGMKWIIKQTLPRLDKRDIRLNALGPVAGSAEDGGGRVTIRDTLSQEEELSEADDKVVRKMIKLNNNAKKAGDYNKDQRDKNNKLLNYYNVIKESVNDNSHPELRKIFREAEDKLKKLHLID